MPSCCTRQCPNLRTTFVIGTKVPPRMLLKGGSVFLSLSAQLAEHTLSSKPFKRDPVRPSTNTSENHVELLSTARLMF